MGREEIPFISENKVQNLYYREKILISTVLILEGEGRNGELVEPYRVTKLGIIHTKLGIIFEVYCTAEYNQ